ncbi:MAG: porin, partial [Candidatus Eisenbacteria bacterium]|nr:porin [Candidatus Eisenbacteria bacterium]
IVVIAAVIAAAAPPAAVGDDGGVCMTVCMSGFVDASYSGNLDLGTDTFGLDQAEMDLSRCFGERGGLRADFEWAKDGDDWALDVEQGYLSYRPAFTDKLNFTFGKFNAPIGFELPDAPDMYQFSHALVFDYGLPTNLTGAMLSVNVTKDADIGVYLVNGWDDNDLGRAGPKTFGGRAGYRLGDLGAVGLAAIMGSEQDEIRKAVMTLDRTVVDVDLTLTPIPALEIGGEFNMGFVEVNDVESEWMGMLAMVHYDFNKWFGLTGRFDWFDDPDDFVFESGLEETRTAITLAPTFVLGDGMGALLELRIDGSSEDVFINSDGEPKASTTGLAFEMTYSF